MASARAGAGGSILLEGGPGVGKTALLEAMVAGQTRSARVTGVESEMQLPFSALADLLGQLGAGVPAEPEPEAVFRAVVALVADAGGEEPLLVCVDDLQWVDASSRAAVAFLARRVSDIPVALVAVQSLRGQVPERWPGVEVLELADLDRGAAERLARAGGLAAGVAGALVDAVGGNPLALTAAPPGLTAGQRAGSAPLPEALPLGRRLEDAYAEVVGRLEPATGRALLLAAAFGSTASAPLAAALDGEGGLELLAPAEEAGLVVAGPGHVRFAHPLVRSAVYARATAAQRRAAHRDLAAVLDEPERAWHLADAAVAADERLATALADQGYSALSSGAPGTASAIFERAADLSERREAGAERLVAAAAAATLAGAPQRARALVDPLVATVRGPGLRADVQLQRGVAMVQDGRPRAAHALLTAEADRLAGSDPAREFALLTQACVALTAQGPMTELAALAARARAVAPEGMGFVAAVLEAEAQSALGHYDRALELLDDQAAALAALDPVGPGYEVASLAGLSLLWMGRHDRAERLLLGLSEAARARGAVSALAFPLAVLATVHLRRGNWREGRAVAGEALAVGRDAPPGFVQGLALMAAAFFAAHAGDGQACARYAAEVTEVGERLELGANLACAEQALGVLHLGHGRAGLAVRNLERAREHTLRVGIRDPSFLFTTADLAEAYVQDGRPAMAEPLAGELDAMARLTGNGWTASAAARIRALLDGDDRLDDHLAAALAAHAGLSMPFEQARTRLVFGERLRRARRRVDARAELGRALDVFDSLDAPSWADRARRELAITEARRVPRDGALPERLTERERSVCEMVAAGATNREVAAALFLSTRTVEHHLRQAYRKLGVRSRTELARRWRSSEA